MKVTVQYRAQARQAAGLASETVDVEGPCSVGELAALLAGRRGERLRNILFADAGELRAHVLYIVGGEQVSPPGDARLEDGDTVTILPPMAGG